MPTTYQKRDHSSVVEQETHNPLVAGSNPAGPTRIFWSSRQGGAGPTNKKSPDCLAIFAILKPISSSSNETPDGLLLVVCW